MKKRHVGLNRQEVEFILDCLTSVCDESFELIEGSQREIRRIASGKTIDLPGINRVCENGLRELKSLELAESIKSKLLKHFPGCPF